MAYGDNDNITITNPADSGTGSTTAAENMDLYGNVIGGATGLTEFLLGLSQRKKAKSEFPMGTTPEMEEAKDEFNRKRKNVFTGSAYNQQMNEIKNMMAGGTEAMARTGSIGNVNYYMRNVAKLTNEMLAQGEQSESNADKNYLDLLNKGDETTRALQLMKYSEDRANQETSKRSGFSNISDAVIELLGKGKKNTRSGLSTDIGGEAGDIVGGGESMG
jgi:predicted CopG family antitoxin